MSDFKIKKKLTKTNIYKPSVLVVTDIDDWAMDHAARNFMPVLKDEFRFTKVVAESFKDRNELEDMYDDYDVVYIMLPSYLPKEIPSNTNIITSFHGGPGTEGQADALDRAGLHDLRISYVSNQVRDRVTIYEWKSNRRVGAPLKPFQVDTKKLLEEQGLTGEEVVEYRVDPEFPNTPDWHTKYKDLHLNVNLHIWKKGFGLNNLWFTPYGVNAEEFKQQNPLNQDELSCGYAGWARYILGKQKDHRRIHWILEAHHEMKFKLYFAGGLEMYAANEIEECRKMFKGTGIEIDPYHWKEIHRFYEKINCYLVPDKWAGGPMPVLEAGLFGIPSVAQRDCGLVGDIIQHMKTGYLVDSQDEFIKGIKFMKENPEKRIEMGQNFKEYLLKHRSWPAVAHYWADFFRGEKR